MMKVVNDLIMDFGPVLIIPFLLWLMSRDPRQQIPMAIVATVLGVLYATIVALTLYIGVLLHIPASRGSIGLVWYGGISVGCLITGIIGFVWAARTKQKARSNAQGDSQGTHTDSPHLQP